LSFIAVVKPLFHWRKASRGRPVAFVPLLLSFQTCGSLAQGQWGRKGTRAFVICLHLRLAVKRIVLDNLCVSAYPFPVFRGCSESGVSILRVKAGPTQERNDVVLSVCVMRRKRTVPERRCDQFRCPMLPCRDLRGNCCSHPRQFQLANHFHRQKQMT